MNNLQKINVILALSKDIKKYLEDKKVAMGLPDPIDLEILVYSLFNLLNDKLKNGSISKDKMEIMLRSSLNQYFINSNIDLHIQKIDYPSRIDPN